MSLVRGFIIKLIITIALAKSVHSAMTLKR
jgi:hypothetical protein